MKAPRFRLIGAALLAVSVLLTPNALLASAAEPHTDPDRAAVIFSPVSLLQYYSETQDYLLRKEAAIVAVRLEKIPFANIPAIYEEAISSLNRSEIELVFILVKIDAGLRDLDGMVKQYRIDEAVELTGELLLEIDRGLRIVDRIWRELVHIGSLAGVARTSETSRLAVVYRELMAKVGAKAEMLGQYQTLIGQYAWLELLEQTARLEPPRRTAVTLQLDPVEAFVGDTVQFYGSLTTDEGGLAYREISILLNTKPYALAATDKDGNLRGSLQVPYEYVPFLNLEALYVPQGDDRGRYLAAKSLPVRLRNLFYPAVLTLKLPDKAYPGRDMSIGGRFEYDGVPAPEARALEIYFDDDLISRAEVGQNFAVKAVPPADAKSGKHEVTVLALPAGRYAPASASGYIDIVRVAPVLRLDMPAIAFFPGMVQINGRVFSDLGPAAGARVSISIGESTLQDATSPDGGFNLRFSRGTGLELIGSQPVKAAVTPVEPWHSVTSAAGNIIVVNWLNSAGIIGLIIVLGAAVRRRLRGFVMSRPQFTGRRAAPSTPAASSTAVAGETGETAEHPRHRLVVLYRRIAAIIQKVIGIIFSPQQTMREYLAVVLPRLGPAGKMFAELTYKVERLLYSRWEPTAEESSTLDRIARQVEGHLGKSS